VITKGEAVTLVDSSGLGQGVQTTQERFNLLVQLMWDLRELGRGSVLYLEGAAEPVLSVPVLSRRRALAVLVVQERGGWSYLWDSVQRAPAGAVRVAAQRIAGVQ
jgi:hypothetical protein